MKKKTIKIIAVLLLAAIAPLSLMAQCGNSNTCFKAGEELNYDLYFKYGLINMKAGKSTIAIKDVLYKSQPAYNMTMTAQSTGAASKIFSLNDIFECIISKDMNPLKYTKIAHEGSDYTEESINYKYDNDDIYITTKRIRNNRLRFDTTLTTKKCLYDMMSIVLYTRTIDYSEMKAGDKVQVDFLSGRDIVAMDIKLEGIETIEGNNNKKYECLKLVLLINDKAFENKEEAMKVYLSNDRNHLPVRIDSKLKIGSTRVILKDTKGLLHNR